MTKDFVSIIVVTYNRINYLKTFIEFLYLFTEYPFKLIVVDNGSIDGTRDFVLEMEKQGMVYKHIFNETNLPLAAAFTEGYKNVDSELFVTVADDMTPPLFKTPDWLALFVAKMESDSNIGCINFKGVRGSYASFNRKTRPYVYRRIEEEGGKRLELFNKLQHILYG